MSLFDPDWKYRSAEESRKPGYLARRFAEIRKKQKEAEKQTEAKVTQIGQLKRSVK